MLRGCCPKKNGLDQLQPTVNSWIIRSQNADVNKNPLQQYLRERHFCTFKQSISHNKSKNKRNHRCVSVIFFISPEQSDEIRLLREFLLRTMETLSLNSCKVLLFLFFFSPSFFKAVHSVRSRGFQSRCSAGTKYTHTHLWPRAKSPLCWHS